MPRLKDAEIVQIVNKEITTGLGFDSDQLSDQREKALSYFFNEPRGDEIEGRSTVQSSDVSDMIEALMAQMMPTLAKETLIQFEPTGEDDETPAQEETDFVSYLIDATSERYAEIATTIKDALMLKNGWFKIFVDVEAHQDKLRLNAIPEYQIQGKVNESNNEESWSLDSVEESNDKDFPDTWNATFTHHVHRRTLMIESIEPENMVTAPDHNRQDLKGLRFLGERKYLTRTELINMGYPKATIENIQASTTTQTANTTTRNPEKQHRFKAAERSQDNIETWIIHTIIDIEQNGQGKLWHIHLAGSEILMKEEVEWMPYCTGSPFPIPHRLHGQSVYDRLRQTQDVKTSFLRDWVDNSATMNKARLVFNPKMTEQSDVLNARPGGGIRSKEPERVVQLQTHDNGQSIANALEYQDKIRSERTGASLDLGAAELQLAGNNIGNQGVERQISLKEMLATNMAANLANSLMKNMFILVHRTVREFMPGELNAKITGEWKNTDPSKWEERNKVIVATGLSQGEKNLRSAALQQVITVQQQIMQQGQDGILTDLSKLHNALLDWCRTANLTNPEQYWTDPQSPEAQQAAQGKAQQAQQQQEQQQQMQQAQMDIFHLQQQLEKYKSDSELSFKYFDSATKAEVEEAKIVGEATVDLQRQQQAAIERSAVQAAAAAGAGSNGANDADQ